MISFASDYIAGAHEAVLARLVETNLEPLSGYGTDPYCVSARKKIAAACECPEADVYFLSGGTQANATVIAAMLEHSEGVVSADTGHINGHEAGAVEYTGHKVLALPHREGKLDAAVLSRYLADFYADENHEHMVFPGMVYVSHPTEYGTIYSKAELTALSEVCRSYRIPLFLDGARLAYGLMSTESDLTLPDIARLCDVFYVGGTKCGALCGEAVVFTKGNTPRHINALVKQHGALLAKGRLLGVQFDALFTDGLYFEIGRHAIGMAEELKRILKAKGCRFFLETATNQQFIIVENGALERLRKEIVVSFWEKYDEDHTVIRLATSWSTTKGDLDALMKAL